MSIGPVPAVPASGSGSARDVPLAAPAGRPGAIEHAAARVGLTRRELVGHLTPDDVRVVEAASGAGDASAVAAVLATERYLGRLVSDLGVDQAQTLYERHQRAPHPIEPAHLAGIITYLEGRRHARDVAAQTSPRPAVARVDRVV
ncbi:hypothetical protein [Quadrisphaera sp. DSM 44207]|uniref:hypothetical protein n=1 Tax=Quadrisphaera sp. DSM 44207 TaxID=1881057 RepID=UPI0008907341|nr:hypothetical protein [Quadrisphaera sp. DSM 44207]SDQ19691.1 hypothetical protein SAMN05428996_1035 [Quadrisphaera sp. DSM 44207]